MAWVENALGLSGFSPAIAALLAGMPRGVYRYAAGAEIITEGAEDREVFLLYTGKARVFRRDSAGADRLIGELCPGDIFGEIAFLVDIPRSASVRSETECETVVFETETFCQLTARHPALLAKLRTTASKRILELFGK